MISRLVERFDWRPLGNALLSLVVGLASPVLGDENSDRQSDAIAADQPYVMVLGTAQDGGYPQAGCAKDCCKRAWKDASLRRNVACLAIVDPQSRQRWIIDATPDFPRQLHSLDRAASFPTDVRIDGILLTHAHIGHYTGLMHLGREVIGADAIKVYAMPRMRYFLETNGPWSQLVKLGQIKLQKTAAGQRIRLNKRLSVIPFVVPHRDEFSETVGFTIEGPSRTAIFLPDIDKWERWEKPVEQLLEIADVAYLDGTFFTAEELPGRDMSEIPHPLVVESIGRFERLPRETRSRVRFIHLNHSNPLHDPASEETQKLRAAGHHVAEQGERFGI